MLSILIFEQMCIFGQDSQFLRQALTQLLRSGNVDATVESLLPAVSWAAT